MPLAMAMLWATAMAVAMLLAMAVAVAMAMVLAMAMADAMLLAMAMGMATLKHHSKATPGETPCEGIGRVTRLHSHSCNTPPS